jgi:hypothetical protein
MFSFLLLILLILIDFDGEPFIFFTALIQYSIFASVHVNEYFIDTIKYALLSSLSFLKIILIGITFLYFECSLYILSEIYFNLMLLTLVLSVPSFFYYNYYYNLLENELNINMIQMVYKIGIKVLIISVIYYEYDLVSSLLVITWMLVWVYKIYTLRSIDLIELSLNQSSYESPAALVVVKGQHYSSETATELGLRQLRDYYLKNPNCTSFNSASKTRY